MDDTINKCLGKQRFESAALAMQIASRSRRSRDCKVNAYRCNACNGWHIGSHIQGAIHKKGMKK